jgi:hypothetical protein
LIPCGCIAKETIEVCCCCIPGKATADPILEQQEVDARVKAEADKQKLNNNHASNAV